MTRTESSPPRYPLYLDRSMVSALRDGLDLEEADAGGPSDLRRVVGAAGDVVRRVSAADDLAAVAPGDLVEVAGAVFGNPLLNLLQFVATAIPLVVDNPGPDGAGPAARPASPGGAARKAAGDAAAVAARRVLAGVVTAARDDLRAHAVADVVLVTAGGLPVVLTLDRATLGPAGEGLLHDGVFAVFGKVSGVVREGEGINLFRRSLLAAAGPEASREMLAELAEGGLDLELVDPLIEGPALQVLPAAVLL